jgi:MFS transporter, DHA1 family, tetracycline resistance protein
MKKPSLLIVFLTVFIDLIGFGLVMPLLPKYVQNFGAPGWMLGAIVASYSLMQFLLAPAWGRLSDRIGRRPVLLISTAGFVVSYALFAIGSSLAHPQLALGVILLSRLLSGVCGANITVAQAYIADLTPPHQRSRAMGLIGMAFGLGFICGPVLAVLAVLWLGLPGPGWVASGICLTNLILAWFLLRESRPPGQTSSTPAPARPPASQWREVIRRPATGLLVAIYFLSTFAFTCFETTLGLMIPHNFQLPRDGQDAAIAIAFLFAFCGFIGALVQGGLIGRMVQAMGEVRLIIFSLVLTGITLPLLPFVQGEIQGSWTALWQDPEASRWRFVAALFSAGGTSWLVLLVVLAGLSLGSGLTRPPLFGLISTSTGPEDQGATLGVAQSAGSLARIVGPVFASTLFVWKPASPYLACALLCLAAAAWLWKCQHLLAAPSPPPHG